MMAVGRGWILVMAVAGMAVAGSAMLLPWPWWGASVRIDPADPELVMLGQTLYARHCAGCHGSRLEGQPDWRERGPDGRLPAPPHDVSGHTWHHPDTVLLTMVKDGMAALAPPGYQSGMPAFKDTLGDREIVAVLSYIKSTWPPDIRARHDRLSRQGS